MSFEETDGKIYKEENGKEVAYIQFNELDGNVYDATSTFVDESQRGQGIARKLVDQLVEKAKEDGYTIKPTCPYVADLFEKEPETYGDIAAE